MATKFWVIAFVCGALLGLGGCATQRVERECRGVAYADASVVTGSGGDAVDRAVGGGERTVLVVQCLEVPTSDGIMLMPSTWASWVLLLELPAGASAGDGWMLSDPELGVFVIDREGVGPFPAGSGETRVRGALRIERVDDEGVACRLRMRIEGGAWAEAARLGEHLTLAWEPVSAR